MPALLKLRDGAQIYTEEDPQDLANRFNASRRDGTLIKVDNGHEGVWINPHALITLTPRGTSDAPLVA